MARSDLIVEPGRASQAGRQIFVVPGLDGNYSDYSVCSFIDIVRELLGVTATLSAEFISDHLCSAEEPIHLRSLAMMML
jgi:hypothetical protein